MIPQTIAAIIVTYLLLPHTQRDLHDTGKPIGSIRTLRGDDTEMILLIHLQTHPQVAQRNRPKSQGRVSERKKGKREEIRRIERRRRMKRRTSQDR